jgi:hypothetical protein
MFACGPSSVLDLIFLFPFNLVLVAIVAVGGLLFATYLWCIAEERKASKALRRYRW